MAKKVTEVKSVRSFISLVKIGQWAFFIGIIVAILSGFVVIPYFTIILAIVGLIVGLLNISETEVQGFILASISIIIVGSAGLQVLVEIAPFVESILKNIVTFVAPAILVVALKSVWRSAMIA
ncbi:MAG: hypothetical protein AABY14_02640 [Nanoarchaeota archaeon]